MSEQLTEQLRQAIERCECGGFGQEVTWDLQGKPPLRPCQTCAPLRAVVKIYPQLLEACKAQHEAIDYLFAMLIGLTSSGCVPTEVFYPSKSGLPWEALLAGKAAIEAAGSG